jgi:two-component system, NarL family, sensor histidine kinase UhpB
MACLPRPSIRRNGAPRGRIATGLGVLLCLLALWPGATHATVHRFADALVAADTGTGRFPVEAALQVVALPDDWSATRPQVRGARWYRLRFDALGARERDVLLGLAIERACAQVDVWLNGHRLLTSGRDGEGLHADCERPLLIGLPAALLEPRGNAIDLLLAGQALEQVASRQRAGGLAAPWIGPYTELVPLHERTQLLKVTLPQVATATLLLMGVVVFVMGWWHRRESHLAFFGALSIAWSLVTARLWWHGLALPAYDRELLLVTAIPIAAFFAVQFLLHYARRRSRPIEVALLAQCVIVPASLLAAGPLRVHMIASSWYLLLALEVLAAMVFYLLTTWRHRRRDFWPMVGLLGAGAAMVALELAAQQQLLSPLARVLPTALIPLVFIGVGLRLVHHYGRALQTAEELRQTLETRIRDATAAMEKSYAQMAELRVEQVTQQERKRIAADLHDDLGAKLLTIVHTSESERISTLAREALEEMRLSVRGLTGKPVKLIDALGDWRAEVVSRLAQTGVEGEWLAPHEDLPQMISARAYVQTTRILREAVNNIIKHSGASRCTIRCAIDDAGDFKLAIQDNGKGIPLELDGRLDRGHGMSSMKHRAKQLQGQCLVESGPGYGTVIRLTIPLEKHTLAA